VDQWIQQTLHSSAMGGGFQLWEALVALGLSFFLSLIIAYAYRETHQGLSYSVSFVHTMILMGVTISIIMLIIGSNIARAFALVGALSIIRFRNAVKDSRDVAFIFVTMAVGMAVGTGFYLMAIVFAVFVSAMIYFLHRFNVGALATREVMLRVHMPEYQDYRTAFNSVFFKYLTDYSLLSVETVRNGSLYELVFSIQFRKGADEAKFLEEVHEIVGDNKVSLLPGHENVYV
jgi:uncharacterized membrane protein YhiD involved in acid resistance